METRVKKGCWSQLTKAANGLECRAWGKRGTSSRTPDVSRFLEEGKFIERGSKKRKKPSPCLSHIAFVQCPQQPMGNPGTAQAQLHWLQSPSTAAGERWAFIHLGLGLLNQCIDCRERQACVTFKWIQHDSSKFNIVSV